MTKIIYNFYYYYSISKIYACNLDLHDCTYAFLVVYPINFRMIGSLYRILELSDIAFVHHKIFLFLASLFVSSLA